MKDQNSTTDTVNGHRLPPDQQVPDEPPPPYTPSDPQNSVPQPSSQQHQQGPPPGPPPMPPRPQQHAPPPHPPPQSPSQPQHRPPPGNYPGSYPYHTSYAGQYAPQAQGPAHPPPPNPSLPFQYPPGYWCHKCHNTGVKLKNGLSCQDCYARFARQRNARVMSTPSYAPRYAAVPGAAMPPRVVRPGDPSIGGVLCGRCRGRGMITEFIFDETCPTCRGVGRLF
ncbi:hypothetical protein TRICI_002046 [Trichomonascus ciferrii]|uniref:Uncharacterized protein n=1 Tax=Trichomonascus ciferrii TaxID=44093 RepID=A0A642VC90_9ASCO|nr:hypothetical protein TRICI_002046 [Trichomonascus ciferrii]